MGGEKDGGKIDGEVDMDQPQAVGKGTGAKPGGEGDE